MAAINTKTAAEKILHLLRGYGFIVISMDKNGDIIADVKNATRFYVANPNIFVRLSIPDNAINLKTSENLNNHPVRDQLRMLSKEYLMAFNYEIYSKPVSPAGEKVDIETNKEKDMTETKEFAKQKCEKCDNIECSCHEEELIESNFGPMRGSTKSSYQGLERVKIVVRHNKPVNEEIRGARSRNIQNIYIQRGGERFKMQENNLMAARAMARHINNGGEMYDSVGDQINELAKDYHKLREFVNYVRQSKMINESNKEYVMLAKDSVGNIKSMFSRISRSNGYASGITEMADYFSQDTTILEDDIDLKTKFTQTHFDDKVSNAMGSLLGAMSRQQAYQQQITIAAESESFSGMNELLSEHGVVEFRDHRTQLATQISQMGASSKNQQLGSFLQGLSERVNSGGNLNKFEHSTLKKCLISANQPNTDIPKQENILENYEQILYKHVIIQ